MHTPHPHTHASTHHMRNYNTLKHHLRKTSHSQSITSANMARGNNARKHHTRKHHIRTNKRNSANIMRANTTSANITPASFRKDSPPLRLVQEPRARMHVLKHHTRRTSYPHFLCTSANTLKQIPHSSNLPDEAARRYARHENLQPELGLGFPLPLALISLVAIVIVLVRSTKLTCRRRGRGYTQVVHGRSRMNINPRIRTIPGRSTSGFRGVLNTLMSCIAVVV